MTFAEKIAALQSDIAEMKVMQEVAIRLSDHNTSEGEGLSMLLAVEVLLREAIMHYEDEIAVLKGPEAA